MPRSDQAIGTVERMLFLKRLQTVGSLPPPQLAVVAEQTRERFFPKGGVLLREGEPIGAIYFVLEGTVHIGRGGRTLGHAGTGAAVGGIGVLAGDTEGIEAVAETDTFALELDADAFVEIFEDHFAILHHVMRETCRQMVDLLRQMSGEQLAGALPAIPPQALPTRELDLVERILFLRQGLTFNRSSINALAELSRGLTEVSFGPGVTLWEEGDPSGGILLIVSGTVACARRDGAVGFEAGAGVPLGAVESMAERPRWYGATTLTQVVALHGNIEGLVDVFEDNFEMAMDYVAAIARAVLGILERSPLGGDETVERLLGCDEASDDPT